MTKKILSCLLACLIFGACCPFWGLQARATSYDKPNTHVNTGDQRYDIVQVALTQRGYMEGPGNNNDTKYGERFGINYLGWCGAFVSWCAVEAGIPDSIMKKTGVANPSSFGLSQQPSGYIPKSGDLFFAKDYSHVGLVWYVEGDYFYTIEGNTWTSEEKHGVYSLKKQIKAHYFASPNYRGGGEHKYVLSTEDKHPHKEFYKCNSCSDMYYTGKTVFVAGCKECQQDRCSHTFGSWSKNNDIDHSRVCKKCDKTEIKSHTWNSGTIVKDATCSASGTKVQTCTECALEKTVTIPKTGVHVYGEWLKFDSNIHIKQCAYCSVQQKAVHTVSKDWVTNEKQHWYNCTECMEQFELKDHEFGETCDSPCKICEYVNPSGHTYDEAWQTDGAVHWRECVKCKTLTARENHIFTGVCDENCDICGFTRNTTHSFSQVYTTDGESHWYECSGCGMKKDIQSHQPDDTSREGVMQFCTACGMQLVADRDHIHAYDELLQDEHFHWGTCSCGMEMERESHTWSFQSGSCSLCGMKYVERSSNEYADLLPWTLGGFGIMVFVIVMIVIAVKSRKKE